jgi:hypothetical protein
MAVVLDYEGPGVEAVGIAVHGREALFCLGDFVGARVEPL